MLSLVCTICYPNYRAQTTFGSAGGMDRTLILTEFFDESPRRGMQRRWGWPESHKGAESALPKRGDQAKSRAPFAVSWQ